MFDPTTIAPALRSRTSRTRSKSAVTLHPDLHSALRELAAQEQYSVGGLVALLINEALDRRLVRQRH